MKKYSFLAIIVLIASIFHSCTNLDILPYTELTIDNYYQDEVQIKSAVFQPYSYAKGWSQPQGEGFWRASELSADQLAWPQKGRHGYDGGDWGRLHYHTWTTATTESRVSGPWNNIYQGVGYCNNILSDLEKIDFSKIQNLTDDDRDLFIREIRAVRAWHYLRLMDLFGNIPIVTIVGIEQQSPSQTPRAEVFKWIESELLDVVEKLPNLQRSNGIRFSKAAVYAVLTELYLNAEVYTGTARWDDCIKYCDLLINGQAGGMNGAIQLDADIDLTWCNQNYTLSREAIFMFACNRGQNFWFNRDDIGTYVERDILNTNYGGNNGIVVQPGVMERYSDKDLRRYSWFLFGIGNGYGPYTGANNFMGPYKDIGRRLNDYCLGTEEYIDKPIVYLNKPVKAVIEVSGTSSTPLADRRITIKEWYCPEFPDNEAKLLMEEAYNGSKTKSVLINAYDQGINEVYNSGGYNGDRLEYQYSWSTKNDYRFMWQDCGENTGARHNKYKSGPQNDSNFGNNHVVIYRLTDIYFAKAEALMRKNSGMATTEAVDLINACKKRAFLPEYWDTQEAADKADRYTTATLTLDELLNERGREFVWEGKRRMDLIRFDKWEFTLNGWWDANAGYTDGSAGTINKDKSRRLFPIPGATMQNNPNLVQNPGYN